MLPRQPQERSREPAKKERAALEWFVRCNRGLTPDQEIEFERWLCADAEHARIFNEFDDTWTQLGELDNQRVARAAEIDHTPVSKNLPPDLSPAQRIRRVSTWVWLGMAAAVVAFAYVGWWRPLHYAHDLVTEIGHVDTLALPDGSRVTLNTDTALAVAFSPTERRLRFTRGEAHFSVAKDPSRPFVVEANGIAIRAVGTAFNVRLRSASVEVLVTEGKVRLDDVATAVSLRAARAVEREPTTTADYVLAAGRRAVVATAMATPAAPTPAPVVIAAVGPEEIRRDLAWQERRLDFVSAPLEAIAAEFNRYNRHKLVILDPKLAAQRFGGSFNPADHGGFVRMLQENFDVTAEKSQDRTTLRLAEHAP